MVVGMDLFIDHFSEYTEHYILIGGGACDRYFEERGIDFRATKDLDIILIVEVLNPAFVQHFWEFIIAGEYEIAQMGTKKTFYRFVRPKASGYPKMLELFSRKPDSITVPEDFHLTDIPTDEDVSSLSAILLDEDYYNFTRKHSLLSDGLHHANDVALIALKAKAFLNNLKRKREGQEVRKDDIDKHRKDVIRLATALDPALRVNAPAVIKADILGYIQTVRTENPDVRQLFKNLGVPNSTLEQIFERLMVTYELSGSATMAYFDNS